MSPLLEKPPISPSCLESCNYNTATHQAQPPSPTEAQCIFFAVIIGINEYHKISHLQGAVNDARAFERYLLDDLKVPPSNILLLENESGTRANILSAIQSHLRDNPNIPDHGEAEKLVFFAGHGSRTIAPKHVLAPEGQVEVICPVDERTTNAAGDYVHAIPDYVLRRLLCDIAAKKGPNITVFLDCCSAGGMDRDVEVHRTARSDSCPVPLDLDNQLWKHQTDAVSYRIWSEAAKPYVMLAACQADQKAGEFKKSDGTYGGRFTANVLPLLQQVPFGHTTYTELMNEMEKLPSGQIPRCVGARSHRPIFSGNSPVTGRRSVLLKPQGPSYSPRKQKRDFRVEMGSLEGVLRETKFEVYDLNNNVLGTFVPHFVRADHTILVGQDGHPAEIPRWAHAKVSQWNSPSVLVYTPDDFPHKAVLFPTHLTRSAKFASASSLEEAHIVVRCDGDEIVVEQRTLPRPKVQQESRFSLNGGSTHLPEVIDGIAHFNYFLGCSNKKKPLKGFELEMHRLQGAYPARHPANLSENLIKNGEVHLTSEAGVEYGFILCNASFHDLFLSLWHFDLKRRTIQASSPWYLPANAPLPSGKTVTLGMGSDLAFDFTLSPGERSSSGFLKLFATRNYVDLAWMQQELSPFDPRFEGTGRLRMSDEPLNFMSTKWGELTVPLTITAGKD
ncbi:ICE-like protease (Caspase) p20 domain protein [Mycena venus]|uniref:ICE-like protease (Caspase) p20 domain protein n=1 Tax=Mycena venus TaxID=2733690 RepID=A0A8H6YD97_9AGAR|nr:ICE-like protease (Caspase) p20 domain protein [Mycena venus]